MSPAGILLVEDDADLRETMVDALAIDGNVVQAAAGASSALDALATSTPHVLLLDIALGPGLDGVELCRRARALDPHLYIMMLTARDAEPDIVRAFESGADDYVTKPVGIAELRSRVRAALRRLRPRSAEVTPLAHGALGLDPASRRVDVSGAPVDATRSEYAVLEALLRADGAVRTRTQLLEAIYGDGAYRDPHGVDVHVHHLRDKLRQAGGDAAWIATVRGVGYRIGP